MLGLVVLGVEVLRRRPARDFPRTRVDRFERLAVPEEFAAVKAANGTGD